MKKENVNLILTRRSLKRKSTCTFNFNLNKLETITENCKHFVLKHISLVRNNKYKSTKNRKKNKILSNVIS